ESFLHSPLHHQGTPLEMNCEREQVAVAELFRQLQRVFAARVRARRIAGGEAPVPLRQHQIAALYARCRVTLENAVRAREPAGGLRALTPLGKVKPQPESRAYRRPDVARLEVEPMRPLRGG